MDDGDLGAGRGRKWGGENRRGNGSSCRHAAQGEETRGGSWQVEGVVDVQVDGVPRRERRWGAGVTER